MKDKIHNWLLNAKNWFVYTFLNQKRGKYRIPSHFMLSYEEDFRTMNMDEFLTKYNLGQAWGEYHPNDLHQWYDPAGVSLHNGLNLSITNNSKHFPNIGTIPFGVGLVVSKREFDYGLYEWNIKLPLGVGLWPAVWLTGSVTWPPEIDIIEGYSDRNGKFGRHLNTNINCGNNGDNQYGIGANRHGLFVNVNETLNLKCHWTPKFIKIYYNDFLCRVLTRKKDMKWFQDVKMVSIMNAALRKEIITNVPVQQLTIAPLKIYDFKYYGHR